MNNPEFINNNEYNGINNNTTKATYNPYHLNRHAHDKGFKDFQKGNYFNNPYPDGTWQAKEWQRGQNNAYKMYLNRNLVREQYRDNLTRKL